MPQMQMNLRYTSALQVKRRRSFLSVLLAQLPSVNALSEPRASNGFSYFYTVEIRSSFHDGKAMQEIVCS